jgi:hypothetical protein
MRCEGSLEIDQATISTAAFDIEPLLSAAVWAVFEEKYFALRH